MVDDGGLSKAQKIYAQLPDVVKEALAKTHLKLAQEMADAMKQLVPVDTGKLRDSIKVLGPGDTVKTDQGDSQTLSETGAAVTYGDEEAFYAHMVEFGTVETEAQPVITPITRNYKKTIARRDASAIRRGFKKVQTNG